MKIVTLIVLLLLAGCSIEKQAQRKEAKLEKKANKEAEKVLQSGRVTEKVITGYLRKNPFEDSIVLKKGMAITVNHKVQVDSTITIDGTKTIREIHHYQEVATDTLQIYERAIQRMQKEIMERVEKRLNSKVDSLITTLEIYKLENDRLSDKVEKANKKTLVWQLVTLFVFLVFTVGPIIIKRFSPLKILK